MSKSYQKYKDIFPWRLSLSLYEVSGWFTPRSTFKLASLLLQISRSKCTQFLGYVHNRKLKQRRFWATRVNRKWAFFSFDMPWHYQICMAKCPYSKRDYFAQEFVETHDRRVQKVHFRLTCSTQKRRCLNSLVSDSFCSQINNQWLWRDFCSGAKLRRADL